MSKELQLEVERLEKSAEHWKETAELYANNAEYWSNKFYVANRAWIIAIVCCVVEFGTVLILAKQLLS